MVTLTLDFHAHKLFLFHIWAAVSATTLYSQRLIYLLHFLLCGCKFLSNVMCIVHFRLFSIFSGSLNFILVKMQDLQLFEEIQWIGNGPPVAEPKCGFRGQKCISKYRNCECMLFSFDSSFQFGNKLTVDLFVWMNTKHINHNSNGTKAQAIRHRFVPISNFVYWCSWSNSLRIIVWIHFKFKL